MDAVLWRITLFFLIFIIRQTYSDQTSSDTESDGPMQCNTVVDSMTAYLHVFDGKPKLPLPDAENECSIQNAREENKTFNHIMCAGSGKKKLFPLEAIPHNTSHLTLNHYIHHFLRYCTFDNFTELIFLDLTGNNIECISFYAFFGLSHLQVLNLNQNLLNSVDTYLAFHKGLFKPIGKTLRYLYLAQENQYHTTQSPDSEIADLQKLEGLVYEIVTGGNETFGPGFSNLKNLKKLHIRLPDIYRCKNIYTFGKGFLENLKATSLECLWINSMSCYIFGVHNILPSVPYLKYLDVSYNPFLFSMDSFEEFLDNLSQTNVSTLDVSETGLDGFFGRPNLAKLTFIALKNNDLRAVSDLSGMANLKHIFMTSNQMETYVFYNALWFLIQQSHLETVELNYQASPPYFDPTYKLMVPVTFTCNNETDHHGVSCICETTDFYTVIYHCTMHLPKNLTRVILTNNNLHETPALLGNITFASNTSQFLMINVSYSHINYLAYTLRCASRVVPRIHTMDLSHNEMECINAQYFVDCDWRYLKHLNLPHNTLGIHTSRCGNIIQSPLKFLQPLTDLVTLSLAHNNLLQIDINLNIQYLHFLDISDNMLMCLSVTITKSLDDANTDTVNGTGIIADFSGNQFPCTCSCLLFYRWMSTTSIHLVDKGNYFCMDDRMAHNISGVDAPVVRNLKLKCFEYLTSLSALDSFLFIFVTYTLITIGTVAYRWRHTLHYFLLRMRMNRQTIADLLTPEYRFHAFVACDRPGAKWVKAELLENLEPRGLKFCIAQRDFIVGTSIIDNIIQAISHSRRIIMVLSQGFMKSGWCREEMMIAHNEGISRGNKNIIICIFMPDVDQTNLPPRFRFVTRHVTCMSWPLDRATQRVFWEQLHRALVHDIGQSERSQFLDDLSFENHVV